jgi:hypothetical protein
MRFYELIVEQEPIQKTAADAPVAITKNDLPADSQRSAIDNPKYATKEQQVTIKDQIAKLLQKDFPEATVKSRTDKIIPHIRIMNALPKEEVLNKLVSSGFDLKSNIDSKQRQTSDTYQQSTYSYTKDGILYTIVLAGKGQAGKAQTGIQTLRPDFLGLAGQTKSRSDVAKHVKSRLPSATKDTVFQQGLSQLIDVAMGDRPNVDANLMDHMSGVLNLVSQNFGEILTPIIMAKDDNELISFPKESNKPLIDAEVNGRPVAVKSLGGSGNSFSVIKDLIDTYEETKKKQDPNFTPSKSFQILKDFVGNDGKTVDKLIRAAQNAKIPEAISLNSILGLSQSPMNYKQLEQGVAGLVNRLKAEGESNLYKRYLETITPAAFSAGRMTKPKEGRKSKKEFVPKPVGVGLPMDYNKYVNIDSEDDAEENKRSAGKKKFDQDFVKAAARQLTYMLGVGFRNHVVEGPAAQEMEDTISDVMSAKNAVGARIEINPNGTINVETVPFSDLRFGYQYHAGTSTVNQNAPGFSIYFR